MLGTDAFYYPMMALAFLCMVALAVWRAGEVSLSRRKVALVCLSSLLAGIIGARIGYVVLDWDYYRLHLAEIPRVDLGGMVFYTGFALGMGAVIAAIRIFRLPLGKTVDLIIPPGAFAEAVGRIGCLLTGCCAGIPTGLPWGVAFPRELVHRHPTQAYETAGLFGLFFLLKRLERRNLPPGTILFTAFLYYGLMRFLLEFIRKDARLPALGFSVAQWISLGLIGWGAAGLLRRRR
jgi:phosphatidylglycerol:prolipoprotein diacylglycerol transferase